MGKVRLESPTYAAYRGDLTPCETICYDEGTWHYTTPPIQQIHPWNPTRCRNRERTPGLNEPRTFRKQMDFPEQREFSLILNQEFATL
jgi:hypothetical protein